jgi:hypothetical protein
MDSINQLSEQINECKNINDKIKMINELNELIENETEKLKDLEKKINENNHIFKIPIKYKKKSIEDLEDLYNQSDDINEKFIIYQCINKYYNNNLELLFD